MTTTLFVIGPFLEQKGGALPSVTTTVKQAVDALARRVAGDLGFEILDIEYDGEGEKVSVRIVLDTVMAGEAITVDDCARFSRALGRLLDEEDLIASSYALEVSSPGVDWPFDSLSRYQRNLGNAVDVWLLEKILVKGKGKTHVQGVLEEATDERVVLRLDKVGSIEIPMDKIRKASRAVVF